MTIGEKIVVTSAESTKGPASSLRRRQKQAASSLSWQVILAVLAYAILIALYFVVRSGGRWADQDTGAFASTIRAVFDEGTIIPSQSTYPHGYGFQAVSTFLLHLTGLSIPALQTLVYPFVAALVGPLAFLFFREVTGEIRAAAMALVFLHLQPDFLFVTLRGSHEKFTILLVFLCLLLLVRSFRLLNSTRIFAVHVGLFYLAAYSLIATNSSLASAFIVALAFSLIGGALGRRRTHLLGTARSALSRLAYTTTACYSLVYIFIFYLYSPSSHNFGVLQSALDKIATLLLNFETQAEQMAQPYTYVQTGWINPRVYLLLTAFNWTVLVASGGVWLLQGWSWLVRKKGPARSSHWLLWLLYAAFALQVGLAIIVDGSGALAANLQLRLFPSFMFMAIPTLSLALSQLLNRGQRIGRAQKLMAIAAMGIVLYFAGAAVFKATNEPLLSNKWGFYTLNEERALQWTDGHLRYAAIWTDFDERLDSVVNLLLIRGSQSHNSYDDYVPKEETRYFVLSDVIRLRSARFRQPLPDVGEELKVYDNGAAELYHLRPRTPYQW